LRFITVWVYSSNSKLRNKIIQVKFILAY